MRNVILIAGLLLLVVIVIWFLQLESDDGAKEEATLVDYNITSEQVDMMILRERLADTAWTWPEPDWPESKAWFQLKADGSAIAGWHGKPCLWTVTSGTTIKMIITSSSREVKEVKFNSDLSEAEMRKGDTSSIAGLINHTQKCSYCLSPGENRRSELCPVVSIS